MSIWVDSNQQLQQVCDQLKATRRLGVDTEFIRTNTFYPEIALIQVSDGQQCWLIDVLAIDRYAPLKQLFESPERQLIFHACAEDLEVLECALDICPRNIFDTQLAAGIVNIGYSMGYARLVEALFEVRLDKQETRSDWLARPLTQRQLDYATTDVVHLHTLYHLLSQMLDKQQRQGWFAEETTALYVTVEGRKNYGDNYLRIKGAQHLGEKSLTALKRLSDWREQQARSLNKPRAHIVKDAVLLGLARHLPVTREQLYDIDGWYGRSMKRYGDTLLQQVAESDGDRTVPVLPKSLPKSTADLMRQMRDALSVVAEREQIPETFLCSKKELEVILRSLMQGQSLWPERLTQGWRQTKVKPALQAVLDSLDT